MTTTTFHVAGMTCAHCVSSVTEEVTKVAGVTDVRIDLASGRVDVTSDAPITDQAVAAAVEEAGYALASA